MSSLRFVSLSKSEEPCDPSSAPLLLVLLSERPVSEDGDWSGRRERKGTARSKALEDDACGVRPFALPEDALSFDEAVFLDPPISKTLELLEAVPELAGGSAPLVLLDDDPATDEPALLVRTASD